MEQVGSTVSGSKSQSFFAVVDFINKRGAWLICLTIGIWSVAGGLSLGLGTLSSPGPGLWPFIIGGPTTVFSTILVFLPQRTPENQEDGDADEKPRTVLAWSATAGLVAATALIPVAGMYIAIFLYTLFCTWLISRLSWLQSLIVSIAVPLGCYFIFEIGLSVRIPNGLTSHIIYFL